ncbi:hypothetical protein BGZ94_007173 [Podila epigama]|nr:hypothetical protein BGZ94_007173 [Podila epigama]
METKKRPNDDTHGPEVNAVQSVVPVLASDSNTSTQPMEISDTTIANDTTPIQASPATATATAIVSESPAVAAPGEPNKRVKLTKEYEKSGAGYSPSTDVIDPAKEKKNLDEWVDHMFEDGADNSTTTQQNQELVNALVSAGTDTTNTQNFADSILAVSSLSEPLVTTLETLENADRSEPTSAPNPDHGVSNDKKEPSVAESEKSDVIPGHSSVQDKERREEKLHHTADEAIPDVLRGQSTAGSAKQPVPEATKSNVDLQAASTEPTTQEVATQQSIKSEKDAALPDASKEDKDNAQKSSDPPSIPVENTAQDTNVASNPKNESQQAEEDVVMTPATQAPVEAAVDVPMADVASQQKPQDPPLAKPDNVQTTTTHKDQGAEAIQDSSQEAPIPSKQQTDLQKAEPPSSTNSQQHQQEPRSVASTVTSQAPAAENRHPETQTQSLPPLSAIAGSQSLPSLSQSNNSLQPSRSTMSLSALLISNEDESSTQRPVESRRTASREMFDPFETSAPTERGPPQHHQPRGNPPPNPLQPYPKLPQQAQQSHLQQTQSSSPQPPLAPQQPAPSQQGGLVQSHSATRSGPNQAQAPRHHDAMEPLSSTSQQANRNHRGYSRSSGDQHGHTLGRVQDAAQTPVAPRHLGSRDYPADEVMESGGVSAYAGHHHRLASPVGIRPAQEAVNASSGSNGKLPGLGSITGLPPSHSHDQHSRQSNLHRQEGAHPPGGAHMSSFSPIQYPPYGNNGPAPNGHLPYPPPTHSGYPPPVHTGHHGGNSGPLVYQGESPRHPRLIVKNEVGQELEGRPEFFLGHYRYDPSTLLPNMQGRENSLFEVRVASTYLTFDNPKVRKRELWGTDIYTDDSDVVAMVIHSGFYIPPLSPMSTEQDLIQPTGLQHNFASLTQVHICPAFDLAVSIRVMPKLVKYQGSIKNRIKSRTWPTNHDGVSFKIESIRKLNAGEALNRGRSQSKRRIKESCNERQRVLANVHDETTESLQNERAMRTATFEFTQQGFKYTPELVMDRHDGLSRKWTSWRLKTAVLVLENDEERYEISLQHQAGTESRRFDLYRFAVISPRVSLPSEKAYPLKPQDLVDVLYEDLDWQDFEWVERGVVIQPTSRPKKPEAIAMEGVESTANGSQGGTSVMDVDRGESGPNQNSGVQETPQQEGVFCVVNRLFWRAINEDHTNKEVYPKERVLKEPSAAVAPVSASGHAPGPAPATTAAVVEKQRTSEVSTISAPKTTTGSSVYDSVTTVQPGSNGPNVERPSVSDIPSTSTLAVGTASKSAPAPNMVSAATGEQTQGRVVESGQKDAPGQDAAMERQQQQQQQEQQQAPKTAAATIPVSVTPDSSTAAPVQTVPTPADHQPAQADPRPSAHANAAATTKPATTVEREEGELEEGEIASD